MQFKLLVEGNGKTTQPDDKGALRSTFQDLLSGSES